MIKEGLHEKNIAEEYMLRFREEGREEGREIGREEGREVGREVGREIGREEASIEIYKKLIREGIDPRIAGCTEDLYQKIRNLEI